jgi:hypothetical protein
VGVESPEAVDTPTEQLETQRVYGTLRAIVRLTRLCATPVGKWHGNDGPPATAETLPGGAGEKVGQALAAFRFDVL